MEEKRTIEIKVRLSESERSQLEERAGKSPLAVFIRESALGVQGTPGDGGASETKAKYEDIDDGSDGADLLMRIIRRFDSVDQFVEKLVLFMGKSLPKDIETILKNTSTHPLAGYKVTDYAPEYRGFTLFHPAKGQLVMSENTDSEFLHTLLDEDGKPLFKVGDIVI